MAWIESCGIRDASTVSGFLGNPQNVSRRTEIRQTCLPRNPDRSIQFTIIQPPYQAAPQLKLTRLTTATGEKKWGKSEEYCGESNERNWAIKKLNQKTFTQLM